jgi:hypothetical protein
VWQIPTDVSEELQWTITFHKTASHLHTRCRQNLIFHVTFYHCFTITGTQLQKHALRDILLQQNLKRANDIKCRGCRCAEMQTKHWQTAFHIVQIRYWQWVLWPQCVVRRGPLTAVCPLTVHSRHLLAICLTPLDPQYETKPETIVTSISISLIYHVSLPPFFLLFNTSTRFIPHKVILCTTPIFGLQRHVHWGSARAVFYLSEWVTVP